MILVKNGLKKVKRDTEDDMLHYLKYSHLENIPEEDDFILKNTEYEDKATQFPNIKNKSTQTLSKEMMDKETDTYDDFHKIDYKYKLEGKSARLKSGEKLRSDFMAQVNATPVILKNRRRNTRGDSSGSDSSGYLGKGIRLAEMTGTLCYQV